MKKNFGSNVLLAVAGGALGYGLAQSPPSGAPWRMFVEDPAGWLEKLWFLAVAYGWPAVLSFAAITAFQLQMRLGGSGANRRTVFAVCVLGSGAMVMGLRELSYSPEAAPSYVVGMALAYTVMSRLYAVRMRQVAGRVRVPWPVWRGDRAGVEQIDREVRARMMRGASQALS